MKLAPEYDPSASPARTAAFGTAVGGLFALLVLSLLGGAREDLLGPLPTSAFIIIAQALGAAISWSAARNGASRP